MSNIINRCYGLDEWWCNFYYCPVCEGTTKLGASARIIYGFKFCPDCGIELIWPEGDLDGER